MAFLDSLLGGLLQDAPKVPPFRPIDAQQEQKKAVGGNLAALPGLTDLASKINTFTSDELLKQLNKLAPGYSDLLKKSGETIASEVKGEIPKDVQRQIRQYSAETAGAGGYSGSSFGKEVTAENLGRTSLDISNRALDSASRWIAMAENLAKGTTFDFTSMFVTPGQQIALDVSERDKQFQRDWTQNQIDAAYDPFTILGKSIAYNGTASGATNWFGGTQAGGALNSGLESILSTIGLG